MRNQFFWLSEAQLNFRDELFYAVETQRSFAIAERDFHTKSKRNLTFTIKFTKHHPSSKFLQFLRVKEKVIS